MERLQPNTAKIISGFKMTEQEQKGIVNAHDMHYDHTKESQ